jgi:hypothetical protein
MSLEIISMKNAKRGRSHGVFHAGAAAPTRSRYKCLINSLHNIYECITHSIDNIDSLNWTHHASGLYGRTHIAAHPRPSRGRDIKRGAY